MILKRDGDTIEGQTKYGMQWLVNAGLGTVFMADTWVSVNDLREIVQAYDEATHVDPHTLKAGDQVVYKGNTTLTVDEVTAEDVALKNDGCVVLIPFDSQWWLQARRP